MAHDAVSSSRGRGTGNARQGQNRCLRQDRHADYGSPASHRSCCGQSRGGRYPGEVRCRRAWLSHPLGAAIVADCGPARPGSLHAGRLFLNRTYGASAISMQNVAPYCSPRWSPACPRDTLSSQGTMACTFFCGCRPGLLTYRFQPRRIKWPRRACHFYNVRQRHTTAGLDARLWRISTRSNAARCGAFHATFVVSAPAAASASGHELTLRSVRIAPEAGFASIIDVEQ